MALDLGWSERVPHDCDSFADGSRSFGYGTREPSSLEKISNVCDSSVGVCGGVMSGRGSKRLGCVGGTWATGLGSSAADDLRLVKPDRRLGVPGSWNCIVLGRNLIQLVGMVEGRVMEEVCEVKDIQ